MNNMSLEDINMNQNMYENYTKNLNVNNVSLNQVESSIVDANTNPFDGNIARPLSALKNISHPSVSP